MALKNKNKSVGVREPWGFKFLREQATLVMSLSLLCMLGAYLHPVLASDSATVHVKIIGDGSEGEPTTPGGGTGGGGLSCPLPQVNQFTPKQAIDKLPFTLTMYGENFNGNLSLIMGGRQFAVQMDRDNIGRAFAYVRIAGDVFSAGNYSFKVRSACGDSTSYSGLEIITGYYQASKVSQSPNITVNYGDEPTLTLTVRNIGTLPWYRESLNPVRLGTLRNRDRYSGFYQSDWFNRNRPATLNEAVVQPGQTGTFTFKIDTTQVWRSKTREYFGLVAEFDQWFKGFETYWDITVKKQPTLVARIFRGVTTPKKAQATTKIPEPCVSNTEAVYATDFWSRVAEQLFQFVKGFVVKN